MYIKIVRSTNSKILFFPVSIYSRVIDLEPGSLYSKKDIIKFLKNLMYKKVKTVIFPGEYSINNNSIELIRRSFDFPDIKEKKFHVKLFFNKKILIKIKNIENNRDFIFFRLDSKLITILLSKNNKQRIFIPKEKYPEILIKTLLLIEDRYFYQHNGISFSSIGRSFLVNAISGRIIQGGSTITQQLVKNLFLNNTRSLWRKINEVYMSIIFDFLYTKNRILELYLNEVYLGQEGKQQIRGFPLASLYYFGRPIDELTLDQYALLVGMVKGASLYNPWNNPSIALNRRNVVLLSLYNNHIITKKVYKILIQKPINIQSKSQIITPHSNFEKLVVSELRKKISCKNKKLSGIKIFITLDSISQNLLDKFIKTGKIILAKEKKNKKIEKIMVIINQYTREIRFLLNRS